MVAKLLSCGKKRLIVENVFLKYGCKMVKAFSSWAFLWLISYTLIIQAIKKADAKLANTPHIPRTKPCFDVLTSSVKQKIKRIVKIIVVTAVAAARNLFIPSQTVIVKFFFCFLSIRAYSSVSVLKALTNISLSACDGTFT